jgi:Complex I intermediate-associated protein 30 (CIA30)
MADDLLIIDDRRTGDYRSALGTSWRLVTDDVMGGVSSGHLTPVTLGNRACLHLRGEVRLENSGGFVQAALDLKDTTALDASDYRGVSLDVYGNGEVYNLHLRTGDAWLPWQTYRASFEARAGWHTVRLPFNEFAEYRIRSPLDLEHLERIAIVAIGRAFEAELYVAHVALYRDALPMPGSQSLPT